MKSSIEVHIAFDFQGKAYKPSLKLDLDQLMRKYGELPDFYALLARENSIDTYSYQYEVMESCELEFSNATGLAAQFLNNGQFDITAFQAGWLESQITALIGGIAERTLGIADLEQHPDIKAALYEAYESGRRDG